MDRDFQQRDGNDKKKSQIEINVRKKNFFLRYQRLTILSSGLSSD